jgi:hypothetical protein
MMDKIEEQIKQLVSEKLSVDLDTANAIIIAVKSGNGTAEQIEAFNKIEQEIKSKMVDVFGNVAHVENQISARNLAIANKSKIPEFLSVVITIGFFGILCYMLAMESKPNDTILIMLGSLGTAWIAIVNYWFGSSSGSAYKSEVMARTK